MRQALAMALQEYTGAVIMVSHDRHLLATVTDRFLLVDAGRVEEFDGDLDDYARWLSRGNAAGQVQSATAATAEPQRVTAQQRRREGAEQRKALAPLRARQARCEKRLQELATEAVALDAQLADPAVYAPGERRRQLELTTARARIAQETESVEAEWLAVSDELERAQNAD
jgi:ATP-binding cassette, subfamily F, member 3